uniref:Uncharacterized protein n=1 Tax=Phytophthora ramorum TaxID=164328 RepID=H3GS84_PHYRM
MARMDLLRALEYAAPDQSGVLVPLVANSASESESVASTMVIIFMTVKIRRSSSRSRVVIVRRIAATRGQTGTSIAEFRTLLELVDHDDVLVAYAAKEELNNVLTGDEMKDAIEVVEAITTVSTTSWRRDAGGFRFQLLQQLLKTQAAQRCDSGRDVEYPYLKAVLNNLQHVGGMVCDVLVPELGARGGFSKRGVE